MKNNVPERPLGFPPARPLLVVPHHPHTKNAVLHSACIKLMAFSSPYSCMIQYDIIVVEFSYIPPYFLYCQLIFYCTYDIIDAACFTVLFSTCLLCVSLLFGLAPYFVCFILFTRYFIILTTLTLYDFRIGVWRLKRRKKI